MKGDLEVIHLGEKHAVRTSALSSGQSRGLQADAHAGNGYKRSLKTLHLADREVDKSLTRRPYGKFQKKVKVRIAA
jgi:hypothetical protein